MSLFIYHDKKLYADTRKVVNFPNGDMLTPCIESKVFATPHCLVGMAGIPFKENRYVDYITAIECIGALCDEIKRMEENALVSVNGELKKLNTEMIDKVAYEVACLDIFKDKPFLAVTKRHVWVRTDADVHMVVDTLDVGLAAVGSGEIFAKIALMNNVHPSRIYPEMRSVGIPVGEQFEVHDTDTLSDAMPPFLSPQVWYYVIALLTTWSKKDIKNEEFLNDFYYLVMSICAKKDCSKMSARAFKFIDRFAKDWVGEKKFRNRVSYKRLAQFIEKQRKAQ